MFDGIQRQRARSDETAEAEMRLPGRGASRTHVTVKHEENMRPLNVNSVHKRITKTRINMCEIRTPILRLLVVCGLDLITGVFRSFLIRTGHQFRKGIIRPTLNIIV
jgi:hypothetical protein